MGSIKRQSFERLCLSVSSYCNHIEVRPRTKVTMFIQEFENMSAADNEMTVFIRFVNLASWLVGKLKCVTTLIRPDHEKRPNNFLSLLNTRPTWIVIRALNIVVRLHRKRTVQAKSFQKLDGPLLLEIDASYKGRLTMVQKAVVKAKNGDQVSLIHLQSKTVRRTHKDLFGAESCAAMRDWLMRNVCTRKLSFLTWDYKTSSTIILFWLLRSHWNHWNHWSRDSITTWNCAHDSKRWGNRWCTRDFFFRF